MQEFRYGQHVARLRKRAAKIATQEQLNAVLMLASETDREGIFEIMEPYLGFPNATCPEGPAQNRVGN